MQGVVGGFIEAVYLNETAVLICNEEGKLHGLPINRVFKHDILCGTFFLTGRSEPDFVSLSDADIQRYVNIFRKE